MPTPRTVLAGAAYVVLAATDTVLAGRRSPRARRARYVVKPLLMPALAVATASSSRRGAGTVSRATAAAQAFSWGGDVALLGRGERAFLTGLASFLAAHLAYIAGFASARGAPPHRDHRGTRAALVLWATTAPTMALAARRSSPELTGPVAGYGTVLATMFAASTALDPARDPTGRRAVVAGTSLFLLSDTLLGAQKFLLDEPRPLLEGAVMATYTAGQGLIALGVTRL